MYHKTSGDSCRMTAFTLIELLIVVAIIAILAAIAVPNFLEAQTRAKVARVQADMRTMATAAETYRVDANAYPIPVSVLAASQEVVYPMPSFMHSMYIHNFLPPAMTTPVAYITRIFPDVFADRELQPAPEMSLIYYQNWAETRRLADLAGASFNPAQQARASGYGAWVMLSGGPDGDRKDLAPAQVGLLLINGVYDPSNGTVSNGDIIRTQNNPSGFTL